MSFYRQRISAPIQARIWREPLEAAPPWKEKLLHAARLAFVLLRDLRSGQLTLRAMSLVYTTLLSLVPLLALSFSVLKAFGVHNEIEPLLNRFLAPLGERRYEVTQRIIEFIQNLNVGVLGAVGLVLLIYTVISLIQKIEMSFNHIWHITRPRSLGQRFSSYLSVLLVGPLLVFSAIALTAAVANNELVQRLLEIEPLGRVAYEAGRIMPYLLVIAAFTFIYIFIPNTRVRFIPAVIGATVGGILWQWAGMGFALFARATTTYSAIYSGFAILILFMLWLYLSWLIMLIGSSVAFYQQHQEYLVERAGEPRLSIRMRERLALTVMSLIARQHLHGGEPWTLQRLTQELNVPMRALDMVLDPLCEEGLLVQADADLCSYLPARDLSTVTVKQLLDALRRADEDTALGPHSFPVPKAVASILERLDDAAAAAAGNVPLKSLADTLITEEQTKPALLR